MKTACDGQHLYLHALNVRMLEHMYGSLEHSPKTLVGRIVEKEGGSMTEELRKRLRYLQHLPVTCQFEVAEIQLKQPVVCKETLEHFNGDYHFVVSFSLSFLHTKLKGNCTNVQFCELVC